jgi:predicted GNAT family acetyltransferase
MTDIDLSTLEPVNNSAEKQFEIELGDKKAVIVYMINGKNIIMHHTEVPPEFEGKGIAGKLAKFALDWSKENGYKVNPLCPYVKSYIKRHPEYQDNAFGF